MNSFDKSLIVFCGLNLVSFVGGMYLPDGKLGLFCTVWWFATLPLCLGIGIYFCYQQAKRQKDSEK